MVFACPVFYVGWKVVKKSKFVKPEEADLVCVLVEAVCRYFWIWTNRWRRYGNGLGLMLMKRL